MILAADVGATKTLLALAESDHGRPAMRFVRRYADADYAAFHEVVAEFLDAAREAVGAHRIGSACMGVAGPLAGDRIRLTNREWTLDASDLARRFGWPRVTVMNDFAAAASGIEALGADDLVTLQEGVGDPLGPRVVLGAGSGLGVAYAVREAEQWRVVAGEGGHRGFAPETERQARLAEHWRRTLGRVSDESFLSGPGLLRIHAFLRAESPGPPSALDAEIATGARAEAITRFAEQHGDPLALEALELFAECYGQVAGDHALAVAARGGVFVAGGLAPKLLRHLQSGAFLRGFRAKGPQARWMHSIPVHVVVNESVGLIGAAVNALRAAPGA